MTIRKFKSKLPTLNESTVRSSRKEVESEFKRAWKEKREPAKTIAKYSSPTVRPLMLSQLD